jgi:protein phosphatase
VDASTIAAVLAAESDPQVAAQQLVDAANEAGGEDNITVIVVDIVDEADTSDAAVEDRADTDPGPSPEARASSKARRFVKPLIAVVILVLLGVAAAQYALSNAWYVGVSDDGYVTIYKGVPEEIAGLNLSDEEEKTDLALNTIPEFKRPDVVDGIEVDSRAEAEATIADLQELAGDPDFGTKASPSPSPSPRRQKR